MCHAFLWVLFSTVLLVERPLQALPSALQQESDAPVLVVETPSLDLGEVIDGAAVSMEFKIRNEGRSDLVIEEITPDCGCTVVDLPADLRRLKPGEERIIGVRFDSTGRGLMTSQKKVIRLKTNDPKTPDAAMEFNVLVKSLYRLDPSANLHLQTIRRGDESRRTLNVFPGSSERPVRVLAVEIPSILPVTSKLESISEKGASGTRITFRANNDAALGPAEGPIVLKLEADGQPVERKMLLQMNVVGEIEYRPTMISLVNQRTLPGRKLAPITLNSTTTRPLRILKADGGPVLDLEVRPGARADGTEQIITPKVREAAPAGPFAAMIRITTDSIDQPIIQIPVYGLVYPEVEVDPPLVILRDDGTPLGASRCVRLLHVRTGQPFRIEGVRSSLPLVTGKRVQEPGADDPQSEVLMVYLLGEVPGGVHSATVTVQTSLSDAPTVEIPVTLLSKSIDPIEVLGKD